MTGRPSRVILIEDHPLLCSGLRKLIATIPELLFVGDAGRKEEAETLWRTAQPDMVVLDLQLVDCNGLELLESCRGETPNAQVLVLSSSATAATVSAAIRAGVAGYILKSEPIAEVERAFRVIAGGHKYFSADILPIAIGLAQPVDGTPPSSVLSPRERQVLQLLALGLRTKEVAARLGVNTKTAETFRRRLMAKLRLTSIADLTRYAIRQGIISA